VKTEKSSTPATLPWYSSFSSSSSSSLWAMVPSPYLFIFLCLLFYTLLVWTPCLMHRCVCIWEYILQNYNYKLHFQNLSIYHIPHVFMGTLDAENLDVCTTCDPSNIQLTMIKDRRRQIYPKCHSNRKLISKSWGCPPGAGHAFPRQRHMRRGGGGGVIYFCQGFLPCMMPSMDGWKSFTTNDHNVLYYM
jgi:hypothetical protein